MFWDSLKKRVTPRGQRRSSSFVLPAVVIELEPGFVAGARLDKSSRRVESVGVRELEPGALSAIPNRPNVANQAAVRRAVSEVVERIGNGNGRLGLLVPDATVRVSPLVFETLPSYRSEAEALVRWRLRDSLSYPPDEARVSFQIESREPNAVELLALAMRLSVLAEYEAALEGVNGGACLTLPATMALLPLLPEDVRGGQVLVHVCSGCVTTVVVEGNRVRSWRHRLLEAAGAAEALPEVAQEVGRVLANCSDHLRLEVSRVWACLRPPFAPDLAAELARALNRDVVPLGGGAGRAPTLSGPDHELFQRYGLTFAGLVANAGRER